LQDLRVEWRIILKLILKKYDESCEPNSRGPGEGPVAGPCEYFNEPSVFTKRGGISLAL
jgi:hypothetical protein